MNLNVSNHFKSLMFKCQSDSDTDFENKIKNSCFSASERIGAKEVAPRWMACDFQLCRLGFNYWSLDLGTILGSGLN